MKFIDRVSFIAALAALWYCHPGLQAQEAAPTAAAALQRLKDGNARFVAGKPAHKDVSEAHRKELAKGQRPFAVVLACADSRVTPELILDQGLGDLLVVRVAGNVTDPAIIGSIEYALVELKVPLIVVLGHSKCGAVKAALSGKALEGNLGKLVARVHVGKKTEDKANALSAAIRANVVYHAHRMSRQSTVIKDFLGSGRARVVGGVYGLGTGKVSWVELDGKKDR